MSMVAPQPELQLTSATQTTPQAREKHLILFPNGFEERIEGILDEIGVPGYSEGPNLMGRGSRGRHFDNEVWPGTTGEIFTAIEAGQAEALMQRLRALDEELQRSSRRRAASSDRSRTCSDSRRSATHTACRDSPRTTPGHQRTLPLRPREWTPVQAGHVAEDKSGAAVSQCRLVKPLLESSKVATRRALKIAPTFASIPAAL
jgi:hypothetical protein